MLELINRCKDCIGNTSKTQPD